MLHGVSTTALRNIATVFGHLLNGCWRTSQPKLSRNQDPFRYTFGTGFSFTNTVKCSHMDWLVILLIILAVGQVATIYLFWKRGQVEPAPPLPPDTSGF